MLFQDARAPCTRSRAVLHEVSLHKRAAGTRLEILFKGYSLALSGELDRNHEPPGPVRSGVDGAARVVGVQTPLNVGRDPDVQAPIPDRLKHIDEALLGEHEIDAAKEGPAGVCQWPGSSSLACRP